MNIELGKKNLENTEFLKEYLDKASTLDDLYHRAGELEETIEALDDNIKDATDRGLDEIAETLYIQRRNLDLNRLNLEIQINKLELDLLETEMIKSQLKQ